MTQLDDLEGAHEARCYADSRKQLLDALEVFEVKNTLEVLSMLCDLVREARGHDETCFQHISSFLNVTKKEAIQCLDLIKNCLETGDFLEARLASEMERRTPRSDAMSGQVREDICDLLTSVMGFAVCRAVSFGAAPTWPMLGRAISEIREHETPHAAFTAWRDIVRKRGLHRSFVDRLLALLNQPDFEQTHDRAQTLLNVVMSGVTRPVVDQPATYVWDEALGQVRRDAELLTLAEGERLGVCYSEDGYILADGREGDMENAQAYHNGRKTRFKDITPIGGPAFDDTAEIMCFDMSAETVTLLNRILREPGYVLKIKNQ